MTERDLDDYLGGYADREVIENTLSRLNERGNYWPEAIHVD